MRLHDKVAIVTGAGRGIGRAIACRLAEEGADLALVARTREQLEETAAQVAACGRRSLCLAMDVTSAAETRKMAEATLERFGQIDILVNNAGTQGPIGPAADNDAEQWAQTVRVNLFGPFLCAQAVLPTMMARRRGRIINLSGGGATSPRPNFSAYGVSKAAVVRFTETLALEVAAYNIQVNAVAPGAVNTQMLAEVLEAGERAGNELEAAQKREREGGTPPGLAAALVAFLASEDAGALTGKLISAPHDGWAQWNAERIEALNGSAWFTLRRIDELAMRERPDGPRR